MYDLHTSFSTLRPSPQRYSVSKCSLQDPYFKAISTERASEFDQFSRAGGKSSQDCVNLFIIRVAEDATLGVK